MAHIRYDYRTLTAFCEEAFTKLGFTKEDSKVITDVLITSDLFGIESHGMQRLTRYDMGIQKGLIHPGAKSEIVFQTPVSAVIDAHDGMGQLAAVNAMNIAIEKAKKSGMAMVTVRNSNHYGIAGYYAKMAADQGLIGFSCTNSEAIMVPTFGRKAMLGSNPMAFAVPADPYPFLFDASTTVVTRGKLEMYNKAEKELPDHWALDCKGHPTHDTGSVLKSIVSKEGGGILPLGGYSEKSGGHKGYGYAMVCEIFSSILSMGMTSCHTNTDGVGGTCHGFMAIDPAVFGNPGEIRKHFSTFLQELRDAPKAQGQTRIYTHGEKEAQSVERIKAEGVPVDVKTVYEMKQMADHAGIDFSAYFGEVPEVEGYHTLY